MKLSQLAAKPQLIQVTIDDDATIKEFGEAVEFWIYDRQDLATFMKLANIKEDNFNEITNLTKQLVLDEDGKPIFKDEKQIPMTLMIKVVEKMVQSLGNGIGQTIKT